MSHVCLYLCSIPSFCKLKVEPKFALDFAGHDFSIFFPLGYFHSKSLGRFTAEYDGHLSMIARFSIPFQLEKYRKFGGPEHAVSQDVSLGYFRKN